MSEARIVKKILKVLREQGGFWVKTHGGPFQESGLPDIIGSYCGLFVSFEVKRPGKEASELQKHIIEEIHKNGGIASIISSSEEALEILSGRRKFRN